MSAGAQLSVVRCALGLCDGSGWVEVDELTSAACRCRAVRAGEAATRRLWAGLPKRFRGVSLERKPICDLEPDLLASVKAYLDHVDERLSAGVGLWLQGGNGNGKTSVAMLVAKTALKAGRSTAAYSLPKLLQRIRSTYSDDSPLSYDELFTRLTTVDLLVLDDLGAERSNDWVLEQLYAIVNERWEEERAVVITTNLTDAELERQLGQRTVSRLAELTGGSERQLHFDGSDRRWEPST